MRGGRGLPPRVPFRWIVPRHRALLRLGGSRARVAYYVAYAVNAEPAKKRGVSNPDGIRIRGSRSDYHRAKIPIAASLLNGFGSEVSGSVVFGDRFNQVGTSLDERIRKLFDALQH